MKHFLTIWILCAGVLFASAQTTPSFTVYKGFAASTVGADNVHYGDDAAKNASTSFAFDFNSFFGAVTGPAVTAPAAAATGNSGFGYEALFHLGSSGGFNPTNSTGFGVRALALPLTSNVGIGYEALVSGAGGNNVGIGSGILPSAGLSTGNITAIGISAMASATTASASVAIGGNTLSTNAAGTQNVAIGYNAMALGNGGSYNSVVGAFAGNNMVGDNNCAIGYNALSFGTSMTGNTANGYNALVNSYGTYNSGLGYGAGPSSANSTLTNTGAFGYNAVPTASNTIVLGNSATSVWSYGMYMTSDGRFKTSIKEDVAGLNFIKALRPVSFDFDFAALDKHSGLTDADISQTGYPKDTRRSGFIAQEVEVAMNNTKFDFSGLKKPENDHDHYAISYAMLTVPLTKAIQELSTEQSAIEKKLAQQTKKFDALKNSLAASTTAETSKAAKGTLYQNIPNPFTSETEIRVSLPESVGNAQIVIYSLNATILKTIVVTGRGDQSIKISINDLKAGIYLYSLVIDGKTSDTKRMILTN